MRDYLLFTIAPYLCSAVFSAGCVMQIVAARHEVPVPRRRSRPGLARLAWIAAIAAIAIAHLAALAFPDTVLAWTRPEKRLIAIELTGLLCGAIALSGAAASWLRRLRSRKTELLSAIDSAFVTTVLLATASGFGVAALYRWASAWSEVTIVPYVYSIARLQPAPGLITHLPLLVKLHVAAAFVVAAIVPFTSIARSAAASIAAATRAAVAPAARGLRPVGLSVGRWTAMQVQTASAAVLDNGEEEN